MPKRICEGLHLVGGSVQSDERDCLVYALDLGALVLVDCGAGPGWPLIREEIRAAGQDPLTPGARGRAPGADAASRSVASRA